MTSKPVAALLADLDVLKSDPKPKASNDNPYSESWFKTLKYLPVFPERFGQRRLPKKLRLPTAAWINEPVKQEEGEEMLAA